MNKNCERCARCNRRKLLATGCLRKWLRPMECKHLPRAIDNKRDYSETDVVSVFLTDRKPPGSTNKFIKFCKNKLFISSSVMSLHRYFTNKVAGSELLPANKSNNASSSAEKRITNESTDKHSRDDVSKRTQHVKCLCLHRDSHVILRGNEKDSCVESCAIYCQLSKHGWYWGGLTSNEAEDLLAGQHDNVFLVRDSFSTRHLLCVSFRCVGRTLHARLRHANGLFSLNNETFVPANKILEHCASVDVATHRFERPVRLARPLNRFAKLDSLQMICRFVIRQKVGNRDFNTLPLPRNLIDYVSLGSDYISPYS